MTSKEIMVNLMAEKICTYVDAGDVHRIVVHGKEFVEVKKDNDQKYECHLEYCAEGVTSGSMMLTKEEYEAVKRVVDTDNWNNLQAEDWSGDLYIWCDDLELRGNDNETD